MIYLWIKAAHIIAVVCWFSVLFYLPRLFVYHAMSDDMVSRERFQIMENKLYRIIGKPSIIGVWFFGGLLFFLNWKIYIEQAWFLVKIFLVLSLTAYHFTCGAIIKKFAEGTIDKSDKFFRIFNEVPVFFLVSIIILAVVKPF